MRKALDYYLREDNTLVVPATNEGLDTTRTRGGHLRRRPAAVEVGGFVAGFDPATTSPYINYATHVPGTRPTETSPR